MAALRLAIIADSHVAHLEAALNEAAQNLELNLSIFTTRLDTLEVDLLNDQSKLNNFKPQIVFLFSSTQALRQRYYESARAPLITDSIERLRRLWRDLQTRYGAMVIQTNFVSPCERFFGNYDLVVETSFAATVEKLNAHILADIRNDAHAQNILLFDLNYIAARGGLETWFDERLWAIGEIAFGLKFAPQIAIGLVKMFETLNGRPVKCVVVDLDNTLWGGVVGDDGVGGVIIGGNGDGRAYEIFQLYLRELKNRGIVLAVCSRNDYATAASVFRLRPEMRLKLDDFACFVANHENKTQNLKAIQKTLGIGFDAIVFLDDDRFEREQMRHVLPQIQTPELPDDPAERVAYLSSTHLFEAVSFTTEDRSRHAMYREESERKASEASHASVEAFLESLAMQFTFEPLTAINRNRAQQLFQRSNQFNLTGAKYSAVDLERIATDQNYKALCVSLRDRFGDYGMIASVVLRKNNDSVSIVSWVMSCRVLKRGVEERIMGEIDATARAWQCTHVVGQYVPNPSNGLVQDLYKNFNFVGGRDHANGLFSKAVPFEL